VFSFTWPASPAIDLHNRRQPVPAASAPGAASPNLTSGGSAPTSRSANPRFGRSEYYSPKRSIARGHGCEPEPRHLQAAASARDVVLIGDASPRINPVPPETVGDMAQRAEQSISFTPRGSTGDGGGMLGSGSSAPKLLRSKGRVPSPVRTTSACEPIAEIGRS